MYVTFVRTIVQPKYRDAERLQRWKAAFKEHNSAMVGASQLRIVGTADTCIPCYSVGALQTDKKCIHTFQGNTWLATRVQRG